MSGFLERIPQSKLKGGSSEILNWVAVAGAAEHLELNWFDYVQDIVHLPAPAPA